MTREWRRNRIAATTIACFFALANLVELTMTARGQESADVSPLYGAHPIRGEVEALRWRVQQLETALAGHQDETVFGSDEPIHTAVYRQQDWQTSHPITLASLADSIVSPECSVDIGGYVKVDLIHDFNAIGSTDGFDPLTIPTDGRPGQNTRLHARQTRLNLGFRPYADDDDLRLFIEGDFFGNESTLRLRHAFIRAGRALAGQTWSTFMDESILARTLDFESPRSVILDRRALFRWTEPLTESLALAAALEDPQPQFDLASAPDGDVERAAPDLVGRVRYEADWGHLQAAGLVRLLRFQQVTGVEDDAAGWGFNFTGRVRPHEFHSVLFQFAFGEGIESYRQGRDAAVDASGRLEVVPVIAWVVGYEVDWTDRLSSSFVYSAARGTNASFQLANAGHATEYVAANIMFEPLPRLSWGVEYLYGTRTDKDRAMGDAHRLQFSVRYDLP